MAMDRMVAKCAEKVRYPTKESAREAAGKLRERFRAANGWKVAPYRCGWCECWHIGKNPRMRRKEV